MPASIVSALPVTILTVIYHYLPLPPKVLCVSRLSHAFSPLPAAALAWDHVELTRSLLDAAKAYPRVRSLLAGVCSVSLEERAVIALSDRVAFPSPTPPPFSFHLLPSLRTVILDLHQEHIRSYNLRATREAKIQSQLRRVIWNACIIDSLASACPQLTNLSLRYSVRNVTGAQDVVTGPIVRSLLRLHSLVRLELNATYLTLSTRQLLGLSALPQLQHLDLAHCYTVVCTDGLDPNVEGMPVPSSSLRTLRLPQSMSKWPKVEALLQAGTRHQQPLGQVTQSEVKESECGLLFLECTSSSVQNGRFVPPSSLTALELDETPTDLSPLLNSSSSSSSSCSHASASSTSRSALPLPRLRQFMHCPDGANAVDSTILFVQQYAIQLQVLQLSLSDDASTVRLWEACCGCTQLRSLTLHCLTGRARIEEPRLSSSSPRFTLPLLTALRIDVHSQSFLHTLVTSCPAVEHLTITDKCSQPLHVLSNTLFTIGHSCRSLQCLELLSADYSFFTATSAHTESTSIPSFTSPSAANFEPVFPCLRSFEMLCKEQGEYDADCSLLSVLVAMLASSTHLHKLHINVHPSPASMLLLAPLTTLRNFNTRWVIPHVYLTHHYISRQYAERWFASDIREFREFTCWEDFGYHPPHDFRLERVFCPERWCRHRGPCRQTQLMDGREAFFAWVATRQAGTRRPSDDQNVVECSSD